MSLIIVVTTPYYVLGMHALGIRSAVSSPVNTVACAAVVEQLEGGGFAQIGRYLQYGIIAWDYFGTKEKATGQQGGSNRTGEKDSSRANKGYYLGVSTALARIGLILPRFAFTITGRVPEVKG